MRKVFGCGQLRVGASPFAIPSQVSQVTPFGSRRLFLLLSHLHHLLGTHCFGVFYLASDPADTSGVCGYIQAISDTPFYATFYLCEQVEISAGLVQGKQL